MKIRALMQKLQFPILQYQRLNAIQFLDNNIVKIAPKREMQCNFLKKKWIYILKGQKCHLTWAILQKDMFF